VDDEATEYYGRGREQDRLTAGSGRLEFWRTTELLERWLPPAPQRVLDVGGGAGVYAFWLTARGYAVHLVDPAPLHLEQARATGLLAGIELGDARDLSAADGSTDVVLLLGPLYHLTAAADRARALSEAFRVLRPGGIVVAAVITRFASALDAVVRGWYTDDEFSAIVTEDLRTGLHRNDSRRPGWFTTAYFHEPAELAAELATAGFTVDGPVAVEGLAELAPELPEDDLGRERLLALVRATEREPSLLGLGGHLLALGRKP
jgi:ubiquinone/menaquinone biosynthesis C-methylase UbiE